MALHWQLRDAGVGLGDGRGSLGGESYRAGLGQGPGHQVKPGLQGSAGELRKALSWIWERGVGEAQGPAVRSLPPL